MHYCLQEELPLFSPFFMEDLGIPILEKLWRHDKGSAPRFFSFTDCCLAHARKYLLFNNFLQQNWAIDTECSCQVIFPWSYDP